MTRARDASGTMHAVAEGQGMGSNKGKVTRGEGWELIPAGGGAGAPQERKVSRPAGGQTIKVREETRAQGKVVTVAKGFRLTAAKLKDVAKDLKAFCGAGGTTDHDAIEVQGRHKDKIVARLQEQGFDVQV
jgi:predicted translation initiation factor SUI1